MISVLGARGQLTSRKRRVMRVWKAAGGCEYLRADRMEMIAEEWTAEPDYEVIAAAPGGGLMTTRAT